MRQTGLAVLMYATVVAVCVPAQDKPPACCEPKDVSSAATTNLAAEWNDVAFIDESGTKTNGAMQCLKALDLYTVMGAKDPAASAKDGLRELTAGKPSAEKLYNEVQKSTRVPGEKLRDLLTTAAQTSVKPTCPTCVTNTDVADALFDKAEAAIREIFKTNLGVLTEIDRLSATNRPRALLVLLDAAAGDPGKLFAQGQVDAQAKAAWDSALKKVGEAAGRMEFYRICYALDQDRLFAIVKTLLK
jgi:hypothetical protein